GAALIGAAVDLRIARQSGPLGHFSTTVRLGKAALVADLTETNDQIVDRAMASLDGEVVRRPADMVLTELAAAEEASAAAAVEARRVLREQHIAERHVERAARIRRLKSQLDR
ncbi:MAG TPA: hypothetical protein VE287_01330, partial [Actinopolymorphaceae bacterium]|nr:hypothetical protein [Actinopolymorphaceae bacterium]